jgi:site-specific DNA recombinase
VEFSPDAQVKQCRDLARLRGLEPVTVLADEGWSGKNLDRPAVRELLRLVELGEVHDLLIWRWDRLSRDQRAPNPRLPDLNPNRRTRGALERLRI